MARSYRHHPRPRRSLGYCAAPQPEAGTGHPEILPQKSFGRHASFADFRSPRDLFTTALIFDGGTCHLSAPLRMLCGHRQRLESTCSSRLGDAPAPGEDRAASSGPSPLSATAPLAVCVERGCVLFRPGRGRCGPCAKTASGAVVPGYHVAAFSAPALCVMKMWAV